jgi:hypothetical protein
MIHLYYSGNSKVSERASLCVLGLEFDGVRVFAACG